jgi:hypothetical protein
MKSVNTKQRPAAARRAARGLRSIRLAAPLFCLLALACALFAGGRERVASASAQGEKARAAASADKATARGRGARAVNPAKPAAVKTRGAFPLADQIGCVRDPLPVAINGGTISGSLAAGDCANPVDGSLYDAYSFQGTAGQFVLISMTSSAVDAYLYLLRPNETQLTYRTIQNDDTLGGNNEVLLDSRVVVVLPETGTYTILANSAVPDQTGSYQLSVTGGCPATPNITPGTFNGTLGGNDCRLHDNTFVDVYSFTAAAGQRVSVTMQATGGSTLDSFLFLLSNDGFTELARNDDGLTGGGDGNRSARIPAPDAGAGAGFATLPAAGTYYILANTFGPNETGNYSLTLAFDGTCPTQAVTGGQTVNGTLATSDCRLPFDGSFMDVYTFEGTAGQPFSATMTSGAFDAYLLLYDPQGFLVDENNNGGGGSNARIPDGGGNITLPVSGTYRIYANAVAPDLVGGYTLTVGSTANCTVTLPQTSRANVPAAGGQFTDSYTVPAGCPAPTVTSNSAFITNASAAAPNAQGQGTFTYTVAANAGAARNGTLSVGGQTFTVSQQASCAVGLSPTVAPFAQAGGAGRFTVVPDNNDAQCAWAATTTANWITINTGATGTGTNRVTYTVAANQTGATRTGTVVVNGTVHTVTQLSGAAPTVAFSQATFSVGEGVASRSATLTVSRTGDIAGASTVEYRTAAETAAQAQVPCNPTQTQARGTASPRCDFAATLDTLVFAPNEAEKTVAIPLVNDVHVEGNETFQVELAGAQGATLGAQTTATVTITDDDTAPPTTNPVRPPLPYGAETGRFFVRMQYLDFLGREPEQGEPWTAVLANCPNPENPANQPNAPSAACDRILVSKSFFESPENTLKGRFVFLYHKVAFGSAQNPNYFPEYADYVTDLQRVTGKTAAETIDKRNTFAEEFVNRPAFTARYNGTTNAAYVDTLLANVNTTLTQAGSGFTRDSLVADLTAGTKTRAEVLRLIVESPEVSAQQFNHAYVATQYYGYLRRTPDLGGYLSWLNAINQNRDNLRVMVDGFLNSTEYVFRFGPN